MLIANMVLANVYVQIDHSDAYMLIDKQGYVAHTFRAEFPSATFGNSGEVFLINLDSKISQLKVSTTQIWIRFELPDTLQFVSDKALNLIERIRDIVSVESYRRLAMRLECVLPVADLEQAGFAARDKFLRDDVLAFLNAQDKDNRARMDLLLEWFSGDLRIDLRLRQVRQNRSATDETDSELPEQGFMLDFDISQEQDALSHQRLRGFFRDATTWASSQIPVIAPAVLPDLDQNHV